MILAIRRILHALALLLAGLAGLAIALLLIPQLSPEPSPCPFPALPLLCLNPPR